MRVLRREWFDVTRADEFRLYPIGDVHLGNAACDEQALRAVVSRIADDDRGIWVGMGDYCDFINLRDPRFSASSLASWVKVAHLTDLAKAQLDRFLGIVAPIAGKCAALLEGNHETAIKKHYERDIYSEIVTGIKQAGNFDADHPLGLSYYGWLLLNFYRSDEGKRQRQCQVKVNLHHGFVGGKLAGAKALNLQRWLWTHDADLVLFGHSHNSLVQVEAVEVVVGNRVERRNRIGAFTGSFLSGAEYAEQKGYFPLPISGIEITLRPGAEGRGVIRVANR